jgi:hypothetical protein
MAINKLSPLAAEILNNLAEQRQNLKPQIKRMRMKIHVEALFDSAAQGNIALIRSRHEHVEDVLTAEDYAQTFRLAASNNHVKALAVIFSLAPKGVFGEASKYLAVTKNPETRQEIIKLLGP